MRHTIIVISANSEWRAVRQLFPDETCLHSPFGEYFNCLYGGQKCIFFYGGWAKIAAAASMQYIIDRWQPELVINLGTCGGFSGQIDIGEIILVERTVVYDIFEQMGDFDEHIAFFSTEIDLNWLPQPYPTPVHKAMLVSGDRDIIPADIPMLKSRYKAIAGDWESGAIAWVSSRNHTPLIILRGVTDLIGNDGSAAYGNIEYFEVAAKRVMQQLVTILPSWLFVYEKYSESLWK